MNDRMMSLGVDCEVIVSAVESPDKLYLQMAGSKLNRLNYRLTKLNASVYFRSFQETIPNGGHQGRQRSGALGKVD